MDKLFERNMEKHRKELLDKHKNCNDFQIEGLLDEFDSCC